MDNRRETLLAKRSFKVSIVGVGKVGAAVAHAMTIAGFVDEIALIGRDRRRMDGEALDLRHASALLPRTMRISAGDVDDAADSDLIILTLSAPSTHPDRRSRAVENGVAFRAVVSTLAKNSPEAVFIVVTNPVDALTWLTIAEANIDPSRILGCGTLLDSARLRLAISEELQIHPEDVRAYVLGEHDETQFAAASLASAGGVQIDDLSSVQEFLRRSVRTPGEIFDRKGYTNFGVAQAVTSIARAVALDERRTFPISTTVDGYLGISDVCLSLPCVVGRTGITRKLFPKLNQQEQEACRRSAESIRGTIELLGRQLGDASGVA